MSNFIEGIDREQMVLIPVSVEDSIGEKNFVRIINRFVDGLDLQELGFKFPNNYRTGRPSYHPADMVKLHVYAVYYNINSTRKMEAETGRNVELIWLLKGLKPDHKTIANFFSNNTKAFKEMFKKFFEYIRSVKRTKGTPIVAIDGTKIRANNSIKRNKTKSKLEDSVKRDDVRIEKHMESIRKNDARDAENPEDEIDIEKAFQEVEKINQKKAKKEAYLKEMERKGVTQLSDTDPDSRLMKETRGYNVDYNVQATVDCETKMIADFLVTNECNDTQLLGLMATRAKEIYGEDSLIVVADKGYYNTAELKICEDNGIIPYVAEYEPYRRNEKRPEEFHRDKFEYDRERDVFICPLGHEMYLMGSRIEKGRELMTYRCEGSRHCGGKGLCVKRGHRKVCRYRLEEVVNRNHARMTSSIGMMALRRDSVEHQFGTVKRGFGSDHFHTCGFDKVEGEMALTYLSYNMKRCLNLYGFDEMMMAMDAFFASESSQSSVLLFFVLTIAFLKAKTLRKPQKRLKIHKNA